MGPYVLVDFLLQLNPELYLFIKALFKLAILSLHVINGHFELLFILAHLTKLLIEPSFGFLHGFLVLRANFFDQHVIVRSAAVLEQDRVNFPYLGKQRVLVFRMLQSLIKHLVKANGINEETSVDSIDQIDFHVLTLKVETVDVIAS